MIPLYKAKEKSDFCSRQCCGPSRAFDMEITDNFNREVIHLQRPLHCPCGQEVFVTSPITGESLGRVAQQWNCCVPRFTVGSRVSVSLENCLLNWCWSKRTPRSLFGKCQTNISMSCLNLLNCWRCRWQCCFQDRRTYLCFRLLCRRQFYCK